VAKASDQWERYGQEDPYYGVMSWDEFHRGRLDETALDHFYATGEEHVLRWIEGRLPLTGRALDFGCGTGRIVIPLSRRFDEVTGVDVSPSMLEECRRSCEARGITNVTLTSAIPAGPFDFIHSSAVFQHVPPKDGFVILDKLLSALAPDGSGALNLTISGEPLTKAFYWTLRSVPFAWNVWNLLRRRAWSYPTMQMRSYPLDRVLALLAKHDIKTTTIDYRPAPARTDLHSIILLFSRERRGGPVPGQSPLPPE
jgi:SAM-dependent methyltransferase